MQNRSLANSWFNFISCFIALVWVSAFYPFYIVLDYIGRDALTIAGAYLMPLIGICYAGFNVIYTNFIDLDNLLHKRLEKRESAFKYAFIVVSIVVSIGNVLMALMVEELYGVLVQLKQELY